MAWIESHQELRNHPKTLRAARLAGISAKEIICDLHYLWWWALDHAEDGNLEGYDDAEIEEVMEWEGEPGALIHALVNCGRSVKGSKQPGFLERTSEGLILHDWYDYAGKLIERRQQDAERKRAARQTDVPQMSNGRPLDESTPSFVTVPYPTVPNPTLPNQQEEGVPPRRANVSGPEVSMAWQQARAGACNPMDFEQLGELESLYGTEATVDAIEYCNAHKKRPLLAIGYISSTLAGRFESGNFARPKRNGSQPEPQYDMIQKGDQWIAVPKRAQP